MTIKEQINNIIASRVPRCQDAKNQIAFWSGISSKIDNLFDALNTANKSNPGKLDATISQISDARAKINYETGNFQIIRDRFNRDYVCIGIGGVGRVGKSTFLQSITGLGESQIPTSDEYYTTAGRSLIVNSPLNEANADMHDESSFIREVIKPMCQSAKLGDGPRSLDEFRRMNFPVDTDDSQEVADVKKRLRDTQASLSIIEPELTGQKGRKIALDQLHDYVAYPEGGKKAGKFQAVANIIIYTEFPHAEVEKIRVMDLPGLGEAGRDLARVQTSGMKDDCDITLCMKRPQNSNVEWTEHDSKALDAMKKANPLLNDQTKFTMILVNNGGISEKVAGDCFNNVKENVNKDGRIFEIIECDAKNRDKVQNETMPKVLEFLAKNLQQIDAAIWNKAIDEATQIKKSLKDILRAIETELKGLTGAANFNSLGFARDLRDKIIRSLSDCSENLKKQSENDKEWDAEVQRVKENVKKWIENGCFCNSKEELIEEAKKEIKAEKGQPNHTINQLRISFREQWETIDEHLQRRIYETLDGFIQAIKEHTNNFIPERTSNDLDGVRKQLNDFADKLENTPMQEVNDDKWLKKFTLPLRRLAEFDLRFRFHLEPNLVAVTEEIIPNNVMTVRNEHDAEKLIDTIMALLTKKADEYAAAMCASRKNTSIDKLKKLIEDNVSNSTVAQSLISMIEGAMVSQQAFCPNRIFYALVESSFDAFCRFEGRDEAFNVWVRGYGNELRGELKPEVRDALNALTKTADIINALA